MARRAHPSGVAAIRQLFTVIHAQEHTAAAAAGRLIRGTAADAGRLARTAGAAAAAGRLTRAAAGFAAKLAAAGRRFSRA